MLEEYLEHWQSRRSDWPEWRPDEAFMDRWTEGSAEFEKQLYDDLAKMLATRYVARDYTFEFCDWVVNSLWGLMIAREARAFSDRLCEVYQAFDDGEWNHFGKSQDPVADYTDPAIAEIVSKLEK